MTTWDQYRGLCLVQGAVGAFMVVGAVPGLGRPLGLLLLVIGAINVGLPVWGVRYANAGRTQNRPVPTSLTAFWAQAMPLGAMANENAPTSAQGTALGMTPRRRRLVLAAFGGMAIGVSLGRYVLWPSASLAVDIFAAMLLTMCGLVYVVVMHVGE